MRKYAVGNLEVCCEDDSVKFLSGNIGGKINYQGQILESSLEKGTFKKDIEELKSGSVKRYDSLGDEQTCLHFSLDGDEIKIWHGWISGGYYHRIGFDELEKVLE